MSRRLRIGIDARVLTGKHQGSRTFLLNLLEHLARIDTRNRYLLYSGSPERTRALLPHPSFEHRPMLLTHTLPRLLLFWPLVQIRDRLDWLLSQYICPPWFPRRQAVVVHDVLFETHPQLFAGGFGMAFRALVRRSVRRAGRVLTVSEASRSAIAGVYGRDPATVALVRNGRPTTSAPPTVDPGGRGPYLLFVGRLDRRKNLAAVLDALPLLRTPLPLVVVGAPEAGCEALLRRMVSTPDVVHRPDVPDAALPAYYAGARVLVSPSAAEGFGLPVIEALAAGTPVVCSDIPAHREVAGSFARFVDVSGDDLPERLAAAIDAEIAEPTVQDQAAVTEHLEGFSWEHSARAFLRALEDAA